MREYNIVPKPIDWISPHRKTSAYTRRPPGGSCGRPPCIPGTLLHERSRRRTIENPSSCPQTLNSGGEPRSRNTYKSQTVVNCRLVQQILLRTGVALGTGWGWRSYWRLEEMKLKGPPPPPLPARKPPHSASPRGVKGGNASHIGEDKYREVESKWESRWEAS